MKIKKSMLSMMLAIALVISSLVPSAAFADAPGNSAAITRLAQLGMIDETITDANSIFTRAQFAKAVAFAKDLTDEAATLSGSTIFPDIESNSELSGYVNSLLSRGLMYGRPDGYFHPEGGVTYAEACIVLVKLLGYTDSDVTGMWPNNYISKATDLKLNSGITLKKNDYITVDTAALMLDRLLDTNVKNTNAAQANKTFSESVNLYTDIVVYDTALTYSTLANNAVLTDKGTYYLEDASSKLQVGNTYRVLLDDSSIEKVYGGTKELANITVDSSIDNIVYYKVGNISKSLTLPSDISYYYHGNKQSYDKLKDTLKTNTSVIFAYNDGKTAYEYAVIVDPVYSKPEVAIGFDPASDRLGSILFNSNTRIIKDGRVIEKSDIEEMDVIYSVTDISGRNRLIYVYNTRAEGNIASFSPNNLSPTSVKIDNSSYSFDKNIISYDISNFKEGDKVAALLGNDGKVVALRRIDYKTGDELQVKILGDYRTSDKLIEGQVLTDSGKYYMLEEVGDLEIGGQYKVNIDGDTIVKIKSKENDLIKYSIRGVSENTIYYGPEDKIKGMTLPKVPTFYYNDGQKIDYTTVLNSLKLGSSVILAKKDGVYSYGVIVDPVYSKPVISNYANKQIIHDMVTADISFIYKGGEYYQYEGFIEDGDVAYTVSDLWGINKYIYISDTQIKGRIKKISPNSVDPDSIQIDSTTYSISKYFNATKLRKVKIDSYVKITLDKNGEVIDVNVY